MPLSATNRPGLIDGCFHKLNTIIHLAAEPGTTPPIRWHRDEPVPVEAVVPRIP